MIIPPVDSSQPPPGAVWVRLVRFIGDSVMMHQALEPLRALGLPLVAWGPAPVVDLFRGSAAFQGAVADPASKPGAWAMAQTLRRGRAGAVLVLPRSTRPLLAAFLARVPLRAGWQEGAGFLAATCSLPFRTSGCHQMDRYTALIARAFPDAGPAAPRPFEPRPEAFACARERLREAGLPERFLALCLGSLSSNKRLPEVTWIALIRHLRAQGRPHALLGASADDRAAAARILEACPGTPSLVGQLDLVTTAAVLNRAVGLVGNDSGITHLGAACGIPVVAVFGPTNPAATLPRGRVELVRREELECIGCLSHPCRHGDYRCLTALDPARVQEAVDRIPWPPQHPHQ